VTTAAGYPDLRYDAGMTRAKIAISLPKHQLARARGEVSAGRADSVSGYIAGILAEQEKRDSLRTLLRDLMEKHGEPAAEDIEWAERMLPRRRRG
jgi:Arc/MetJ-type ribon-helix-helix transcriptional regulator